MVKCQMSPGPGNYNPRPLAPSLHLNKTSCEFWIAKDKNDQARRIEKLKERKEALDRERTCQP
jgi:hypothetical protein